MLLECYPYAIGGHWKKKASVGQPENAPIRDVFRVTVRSWKYPLGEVSYMMLNTSHTQMGLCFRYLEIMTRVCMCGQQNIARAVSSNFNFPGAHCGICRGLRSKCPLEAYMSQIPSSRELPRHNRFLSGQEFFFS